MLEWPSKGADMKPIENIWANIVNSWESEREKRPGAAYSKHPKAPSVAKALFLLAVTQKAHTQNNECALPS